jgi:uncharacterized protein (TIGR02001 family)
MTNLTKTFLMVASLGAALSAGNAYAQGATPAPAPAGILGPDFAVSAAVAIQSDYRFRGISQNSRDPAPQGTLNITGPDGFYVGTWASKINWDLYGKDGNPSLEVDEYIGKHTDLWGTDLNVEAYYYSYPDAQTFHNAKASFLELIGQLSHTFGPLALTATYAYSPAFSLGGGTGNYVEGTAAYTINDWLSVSGNVGHQWVQNAKYYFGIPGVSGDYTHFDIGMTAIYRAFSLDARYVDTDLDANGCSFYMGTPHACAGGFVATLTYNVNPFPW